MDREMKLVPRPSAICDQCFWLCPGGNCLACLSTMSMVTRTDALRTWRCWSAKVFGYDGLTRLTTAVTRKVVSRC
ncbi:hypothetical protein A2U01_0062823 [Trifolium medium]|uniref:Uncharacterized protein n=1 Tax=Trifolium medium TaxID=97028 RepID=A0A392S0R1_9FABA|nr:hypothetical protein [Trifolium medium]